MTDNIFEDLADWWLSKHHFGKEKPNAEDVLGAALQELGIMGRDESILSRRVVSDWHQETEETYESVAAIDFEGADFVRTETIAAYAVITPVGLPIEERLEIWKRRSEALSHAGVRVPAWYLIWQGTIYSSYPPHGLIEYLNEEDLDEFDTSQLAKSLIEAFNGLAQLRLRPLGVKGSLRTNGLEVFYCGMGFDVGESSSESPEALFEEYESATLPYLPEYFKTKYLSLARHGE